MAGSCIGVIRGTNRGKRVAETSGIPIGSQNSDPALKSQMYAARAAGSDAKKHPHAGPAGSDRRPRRE
jgi:hypothetical protein